MKICSKYSFNAGGISNIFESLNISKKSDKGKNLNDIELILKSHETAITGRALKKKDKFSSHDSYSLSALNTSESPETVINALKKYIQISKDSGYSGNLNLLFYGAPGTGKTEFARYLAHAMDKELVLRRVSDLLDCYVGGTEKLIAQVFEQAELDESILFIDEADSFLSPRSSARNSWEKTQVNEFLTQMESFKGILVCATNFKEGLDEAALRRFKFKVEFRPLTFEGVKELYLRLIAPKVKTALSPSETERLNSLKNLTAGDFHVVAERLSLSGDKPSHDAFITGLEEEASHKKGNSNIGF